MKKTIIKIVLVLAGLLLIYIIFIADDDKIKDECDFFVYDRNLYLSGYSPDAIEGSAVYVLDKESGKVVDSTTILSTSQRFSFEKPLRVDADWKIVLNKGKSETMPKEFIISDIELTIGEHRDMFGKVYICEIGSWKVNGIQHSIFNGDEFILSRTE